MIARDTLFLRANNCACVTERWRAFHVRHKSCCAAAWKVCKQTVRNIWGPDFIIVCRICVSIGNSLGAQILLWAYEKCIHTYIHTWLHLSRPVRDYRASIYLWLLSHEMSSGVRVFVCPACHVCMSYYVKVIIRGTGLRRPSTRLYVRARASHTGPYMNV